MRINKYIASSGFCSRRKAEEYILEGLVSINGEVVKELGIKIDPSKDEVIFNGKKVSNIDKKVYILLNKPIGYVTTTKDQFRKKYST